MSREHTGLGEKERGECPRKGVVRAWIPRGRRVPGSEGALRSARVACRCTSTGPRFAFLISFSAILKH